MLRHSSNPNRPGLRGPRDKRFKVERVAPNALFAEAIGKRLEGKPLGKLTVPGMVEGLGALSLSNGPLHRRCRANTDRNVLRSE